MTTTKTKFVRHTINIDLFALQFQIEAPAELDAEELGEALAETLMFKKTNLTKSVRFPQFKGQEISVDDSGCWEAGANWDVSVQDTEEVEED